MWRLSQVQGKLDGNILWEAVERTGQEEFVALSLKTLHPSVSNLHQISDQSIRTLINPPINRSILSTTTTLNGLL